MAQIAISIESFTAWFSKLKIEEQIAVDSVVQEKASSRAKAIMSFSRNLPSNQRGKLLDGFIAHTLARNRWNSIEFVKLILRRNGQPKSSGIVILESFVDQTICPILPYRGQVSNDELLDYLTNGDLGVFLPPEGSGSPGPDIIVRLAENILVVIAVKQSDTVVSAVQTSKNRQSANINSIWPKWTGKSKKFAVPNLSAQATEYRRRFHAVLFNNAMVVIKVQLCFPDALNLKGVVDFAAGSVLVTSCKVTDGKGKRKIRNNLTTMKVRNKNTKEVDIVEADYNISNLRDFLPKHTDTIKTELETFYTKLVSVYSVCDNEI